MEDHAHYSIPNIDGPFGVKVFKPEFGLKPSLYLGAAGMPAQTAFYGWKEYADAKPVCPIFISSVFDAPTTYGRVKPCLCPEELVLLEGQLQTVENMVSHNTRAQPTHP